MIAPVPAAADRGDDPGPRGRWRKGLALLAVHRNCRFPWCTSAGGLADAAPARQAPVPLVVGAVRDGGVVELLVDVDEDGVAFDLAGVDGQRGDHGDADRLAGGQVEP